METTETLTLQQETPAAEEPQSATENDIVRADDSDPAALLAELQQYRAAAEDRALTADPVRGPLYTRLREDVHQLLDDCNKNGMNISARAALSTILYDQLADLKDGAADTARRSALQAVAANAKASPGPLSAAAPTVPDFENMSSEEFEKYHFMALHGGL